MPTKTEKAPPQGLPNTPQISNGSVAIPAGKTDALGTHRREELARLQRHPNFQLLRPVEARVLRYVVKRYLSPRDGIFASQATIASKMRLHEDTVRKALRVIVKAGLLTVERRGAYNRGRGGRTSNRYLLVANEDNIQEPDDPVTSPVLDPVSDPVTSLEEVAHLHEVITCKSYAKEVLRTSNVKERSSIKSVVASKEAPTVESQIHASGEVFGNEVEEPSLVAARSSSQLPNSTIGKKNSELVGIEPPRSGVTYSEMTLGLLGFGGIEASYAHASPTRERTSGLLGIEPRRPVQERAKEETEEQRFMRQIKEREAAGVCVECAGSEGVEIYPSLLRCATCRAAHDEIDRKYKLGRFAVQAKAKDDRMPWEGARTETHSVQSATDEGETSVPEKPEQKRSPLIDYEQRIAGWVASGGAAISSEPPELQIPTPPEADRQVEEMPWERIERKLDELPASVAIAVGGHPAEEAKQALAEADAERGFDDG